MQRKSFGAKRLAACAMLAAVSVVLARFIIPMPNATTRFSVEAAPVILAGLLMGPLPGALVGFVADVVGCLFSGYGYNPVFSLPPVLIGLCAGLMRFMVCERVSFFRVLATFLPAVALGSVLWQSWWLSFFYGTKSFGAFLAARSIQFAVTSLINAAVVTVLLKSNVFARFGLQRPEVIS